MSSTNFINAARQAGRLAGVEARSQTNAVGNPDVLQIGKVSQVFPDGGAKVDIIDDGNNVVGTHDYAVPVPHASLNIGDLVWLVQLPGSTCPYILVSGGGSTCATAVNNFGVLFGG